MEAIIKEALSLIKPNMSISLGGGSNVAHLASAISQNNDLKLMICTPSEITKNYCESIGLTITNIETVPQIDLAFDGCDSLDNNLNALKSNGGIHLSEKINAELANEYIILTPLQRFSELLDSEVPLTLEIVEPALKLIQRRIEKLHLEPKIRLSSDIAGYTRTPSGNILIDCYSKNWRDIDEINASLIKLNGVVATSFFKDLVTMVLAFDENGQVHKFRREK